MYYDRSFDNAPDQTRFLNISMANRDPRVWGEESDEFKLRPMREYHRLSLMWAEAAEVRAQPRERQDVPYVLHREIERLRGGGR